MSYVTDFIKRMTHGRITADENILRTGDAFQLAMHLQNFQLGTGMLRLLCNRLPKLDADVRERLVAAVATGDRLVFQASDRNKLELLLEYVQRESDTIPVLVYGYFRKSGTGIRDLPLCYSCTAPILELYTEGCEQRRWVMVALVYNNLTGEEVLRETVGASSFGPRGYDALWRTASAAIEDWSMVKQSRSHLTSVR